MSDAAWRWAAVLCCGPDAVLSHRCAAQLWDMPVRAAPRPEISVRVSARVRLGSRVHLHNIAVPRRDIRAVCGLPVTSRQCTVLDCLLTLPHDQGRTLLDRALQRGWMQLPGIVAAVHDASGR